jgi:hypothetical protein
MMRPRRAPIIERCGRHRSFASRGFLEFDMGLTLQNRFFRNFLLGALAVLVGGCAKHVPPPPPKPAVSIVGLHAKPVSTSAAPGARSAAISADQSIARRPGCA